MRQFQKGLLLLAIPILGQFLFVIVLLGANKAAEDLAWKNQHYRTETQELMSLMVSVYKSVLQLSAYGYVRNEKFITAFDRRYDQLVRKAEFLKLLDVGATKEETLNADAALKSTFGILLELRQSLKLKQDPLGTDSKKALIAESVGSISESLSSLDQLLAARSRVAEKDSQIIERNRGMYLTCIIGGFSLNLLVAAVLLIIYAKDFAARFNVLVENAKSVPTGKSLQPKLTGSDEIAMLDAVMHDMDDALKAAEARKQEFLAMVSHDMRSPLTSVLLSSEIISSGAFGEVPPKIHQKLADNEATVRRLCRLVNDILDAEKIKSGKMELTLQPVDIDQVIEKSLAELRPIANYRNAELICLPSYLCVAADEDRLSQILNNLVANAIKFSPAGGRVIVGSNAIENKVRIFVRDFGPGISPEFRKTIFLPFEQAPDEHRLKAGTTGLGLTICKSLVEMHHGEIGVSDPDYSTGMSPADPDNRGSVFWFTLPAFVEEQL